MKLIFKKFNTNETNDRDDALKLILSDITTYIASCDDDLFPLGLNFFIRTGNHSDFLNFETNISDFIALLKIDLPLAIIAQAPANGDLLIAEMMLAGNVNREFVDMINQGENFISINYPAGKLTFFKPSISSNVKVEKRVFEDMADIVGSVSELNNIIRAWHYIPDITGFESRGAENKQNYQLVNEYRDDVYSRCKWTDGYPAATGIGLCNGRFLVQTLCFEPAGKTRILRIPSPLQCDPADYSGKVIISGKKTPKFERAKLVLSEENALLFISGTASIRGEETLEIDNAAEQTGITLENINAIVEKIKLDFGINDDDVRDGFWRVYIKNIEDYHEIKKVCCEQIRDKSVNYLIADICRDKLLVEIEANFNISGDFTKFL